MCQWWLFGRKKCRAKRHTPMYSVWLEVSKMGKTKILGVCLPQLYPNLHFTNIINLKKSLHKQNLFLHKCCSEGPICIKKFQFQASLRQKKFLVFWNFGSIWPIWQKCSEQLELISQNWNYIMQMDHLEQLLLNRKTILWSKSFGFTIESSVLNCPFSTQIHYIYCDFY